MTSFAAQGWQEENGVWYYYDNSGDYVYDEWKKSGNNWFYLGDDGAMMTDSLIEDGNKTYYVNANGAMVTNSWVAVEPGDDADYDAPDHYWYYFGANGQAVKQSTNGTVKKKVINGKTYAFDTDGRMLYGFVDEDGDRLNDQDDPYEEALYYFGTEDDGAMHTDWLLYTDGSSDDAYTDYDEMWFYFKPSTGKMVKDDSTTVRGNTYLFDDNGVMEYDWKVEHATKNQATSSKYYSDQTDGHLRKKTWVWAVPDKDQNFEDNEAETERWFYVGSNGKAYTGLKTVNGKKYLFDEYGIMKAGLQVVKNNKLGDHTDIEDGNGDVTGESIRKNTIDGTLYYFGDEETDGSMKTGKSIKIELDDGETYTFGFGKTGKAMNGFEDKNTKYYVNGLLITASSDYKYQAFEKDAVAQNGVLDAYDDITVGADNTVVLDEGTYVVSNTGSIVKKEKAVKDTDGNYYAVNPQGRVAFISADHEYASKAANCYADGEGFGDYKKNDDGEITGWTCD